MSPSEARVVALLPMKAHSERVPGKNFRVLAGKPLFRWILDTLLSLDEVAELSQERSLELLALDDALKDLES